MFNARNQDISLACRLLDSKSLYTATNLNSNRLIENVYYGSKSTKLVCVHCGAADIRSAEYKSMLKQYKNVFPVCQHCFNKGKKEICRNLVEPFISSSNKGNISKSAGRVTTNESVKGCYSISSPGTSIDEVVQFNVCQTDDEVVVINERKSQSIIAWNTVPKKKGNKSHCDVCGKEDPPTNGRKGKKVDWVDCDHCSKWTHLDCTENWRNLRKNYWLCEAHK